MDIEYPSGVYPKPGDVKHDYSPEFGYEQNQDEKNPEESPTYYVNGRKIGGYEDQ